jgi:hypothetical protein
MSQHDTATEQVLEAVTKYPLLHVKQEPVELLEEQALQLESKPERNFFLSATKLLHKKTEKRNIK